MECRPIGKAECLEIHHTSQSWFPQCIVHKLAERLYLLVGDKTDAFSFGLDGQAKPPVRFSALRQCHTVVRGDGIHKHLVPVLMSH